MAEQLLRLQFIRQDLGFPPLPGDPGDAADLHM